MSQRLKVMNRETGKWEEREPFDGAFLQFAVETTSQYDATCRRMAAQILSTESQLAAALAKVAELEAERDAWRTSASMACESPPPRCDCAGCRFAEQHRAEEASQLARPEPEEAK